MHCDKVMCFISSFCIITALQFKIDMMTVAARTRPSVTEWISLFLSPWAAKWGQTPGPASYRLPSCYLSSDECIFTPHLELVRVRPVLSTTTQARNSGESVAKRQEVGNLSRVCVHVYVCVRKRVCKRVVCMLTDFLCAMRKRGGERRLLLLL